MQIKEALQQGTAQLKDCSDSARLDCELLLAYSLGKERSYLFTWPEASLNDGQQQVFNELVESRKKGQPIAYLLGYREFWGLKLAVSPDTLIPRPETELLVEQALEFFSQTNLSTPKIIDLGTGSGAIAIALAKELPQAQVIATDISPMALKVAKQNAVAHQLTKQITFIHSDWFSAIPDTEGFDLIISNPPYIAEKDRHLTQGDVRFEPQSALTSGLDGLDAIRILIKQAMSYLRANGMVMVEHGYDQGQQIIQLLSTAGYADITCIQDLAGHDRLCIGRAP